MRNQNITKVINLGVFTPVIADVMSQGGELDEERHGVNQEDSICY